MAAAAAAAASSACRFASSTASSLFLEALLSIRSVVRFLPYVFRLIFISSFFPELQKAHIFLLWFPSSHPSKEGKKKAERKEGRKD